MLSIVEITMTIKITNDVLKASSTLCKAFSQSAAGDYIMKKFFNISIQEPVSRKRIDAMIHYYTALYHDLEGEIIESNDYDAVALWSTPGKHLTSAKTNDPVFNKNFIEDLSARKKEVIPEDIGYYYLFMIGKDLSKPEIRGSVRAIFQEFKARADEKNCAIVLECISDHAKQVYEYFGFEDYLTFRYGVGEVNSKGEYDPNGEGFVGHLMFYHKDGDKILRK